MDLGNDDRVESRATRAATRAGRPKGATADRILVTAKRIIAEDGIEALRLAQIAATLKISTPALYAHFPGGRNELIDQIAREGVRGMARFFPLTGKAAQIDLFWGLSDLVRFFADNGAFLRIMLIDFSSPKGHASISREIGTSRGNMANGAFQPMFNRLASILEGCAGPDQAAAISPRIFLNIVVGAVALNLIYPPKPHSADEDAVAAVDAIIRDLVRRYLGIAADVTPLILNQRQGLK